VTEGFATGERVYVEIDGARVDGIFVRAGQLEPVGPERPAEQASKRDVAWVRRADTGEVEPFDRRLVSAA
jgi:hypothetical protein